MSASQILSVAQMRRAEQAIIDAGSSVEELMEIAAGGAAEWIRRVAAGRSVTVLCGPGNNGGDGYVIARRLREWGNPVTVIAPTEPASAAARKAREALSGPVLTSGRGEQDGVFVDCLFGSGLSRPLSPEHALLLRDCAQSHAYRVAIDMPSSVDSDSGAELNDRLPNFDLTLALGAWKFAHWVLPARSKMGARRLVPIGVERVEGAADLIVRPSLRAPATNAHKYARGLAAVIAGEMPGAAILSATAAQRAGAGYVKLLAEDLHSADPGLVIDTAPLADALDDNRIGALLVGPGLGRSDEAREKLGKALQSGHPLVVDADALVLLEPGVLPEGATVLATPHDGELEHLCRAFAAIADTRRSKAIALARASGIVICAKGPDTFVAAPDGRLAIAPPASSWLSVAGSGDVLAGIAVSRMATGSDAFSAACEAVWLHGEAARRCEPPFTAHELAMGVAESYRACL